MNSLKTAAANIFASLNYTREQREALYQDTVTEMFNAVKEVCEFQLDALAQELKVFDQDNWIVGDECGNALLILKDLGSASIDEVGSLEVVMRESGEIWARVILDHIYSDGFEPMLLKGGERTLLTLLNEYVEETTKSYDLAGLTIAFEGKDILKK